MVAGNGAVKREGGKKGGEEKGDKNRIADVASTKGGEIAGEEGGEARASLWWFQPDAESAR